MNPSSRFSVLASCSEGCFGKIIYRWEVYHNEGDSITKKWKRRDDILEAVSVQDPNGPSFALPRDVFEGNEEYLIRAFGGRENGVPGKSELTSITNDPPKGGSCTGSPSVGEALVTDFVLSCSNWTDVDTPLTYEFNHKNEEGKLALLSFGENKRVVAKLPLGDPKLNFTLEMHVKILDYYRGESSFVFLIQVFELDCPKLILLLIASCLTSLFPNYKATCSLQNDIVVVIVVVVVVVVVVFVTLIVKGTGNGS